MTDIRENDIITHNMNNEIENIKKYVRAANYLSASQIYLQSNFLLEDPKSGKIGQGKLTFDDIKTRLLGHWGTCPGINFVYGCLNNLIKKTDANMMFVLGPGHGFPAIQSNIFLEGTLGKYYKEAQVNKDGIAYISKNFSWPYGFPSHSSPATPGVILEGGELGYSLSTSYGAVLDNPDLIVSCLIGDGEAETGALATSWHLYKFIDPAKNGAVLPILHLNGYKISGPTVFGRMSNSDLKSLFKGYGYEPIIVEGKGDKVYEKMIKTLEESYNSIRKIQKEVRENEGKKREDFYRFPMIILKTPKGWTGIKELDDKKIEGNCLSHQVVGKDAKTNKIQLKAVEKWLKSYKFEELFDLQNGFSKDVLENIPKEGLRMGDNQKAFGLRKGDKTHDLVLPKVEDFEIKITEVGTTETGAMKKIGEYLSEVVRLNQEKRNFRLFSPDETYSNRLQDIFKNTTRSFAGKIEDWDDDMSSDGRVIEMLSEQSLQGLAQGYTLTGRFSIFTSYEAFIPIVSSMADQYSKFLKIAKKTEWRGDVPSFNYLLTSTGWRQEHNGFSHQNPGFIDGLLQKHHDFINVYFPVDANEAVLVTEKCLSSKNEINIIVSEKTIEPIWLSMNDAKEEIEKGLSIWKFASDENPDVVFCGCGQYLVKEALAGLRLLKSELPEVKVRFVNVVELSPNTIGHSKRITEEDFEKYFTKDKPVIFNFHGYPETLKQILFDYQNALDRLSVFGYMESGSTTTPLDLHIRNKTDRYNLLIEAIEKLIKSDVVVEGRGREIIEKYKNKIKDHKEYIIRHGDDSEDVLNWKWNRRG
ncbi:MAG: phosphoketolase family protein [Candidatus Pacebacteria bacterium]|nr:phosphoketolase family protein [Candidatus Paceibacterota bacterium]